ncbi:MAG: GatB/YqeY domain-containing protein [Patescibacteria group bacterium]
MILNTIREEIKVAMRAKDTMSLNTLRGVLAAFTNELVATKRKPQEELTDEEALNVIKRLCKQRKDSIEQFKTGGRADLVLTEEKELQILKKYLPEEVGEAEIRKVAESKKVALKVTDKAKIGILVGAVMKELKGKADGASVKKVIESLF